MRVKTSLSFRPSTRDFLTQYAKKKKKSQSDILEEIIIILQTKEQELELQNGYLQEALQKDDFSEIAVQTFFEDFPYGDR
ncbi:MAG: hypothetical protein WCJ84_02395 [Candidatus Peregrinibacteria bacterium]